MKRPRTKLRPTPLPLIPVTTPAKTASQLEIALLAFVTVLTVAFFLLAVFVSVRQRRLSSRSGSGYRGRTRLSRVRMMRVCGKGREGDGDDEEEGEMGYYEEGRQSLASLQGAVGAEEKRGCYYYEDGGAGDDCGGGGGREAKERVRRMGERAVGWLQEVGKRARFAPPPPRDVEFGFVSGGGYGRIGGQVDGFEAGRDSAPLRSTGRRGWFLPGECQMRRRGSLRVSAEGECPV
ncbi:hypothetical protein C8A01DRAFT_36824 [Parachaetomium inaequale]|uniref:Uncharacterized protein n=1 Tax=Parachaetomium inaequale TaxID=2588326 RepID=A0AAN6SR87_9PEZI|nr:hypothetical protein C8A01DRAFT_36824 [Parachaetomium inaequale]